MQQMNTNSEQSSPTETTPNQPAKPEGDGLNSPKTDSQNSEAKVLLLTDRDSSSSEAEDDAMLTRREQAYYLSVVERRHVKDVAKELQVSASTVRKDLKWVTQQRIDALVENDKALVVEQDGIYEALLEKWLPVALRDDTLVEVEGHMVIDTRPLTATDKILKILSDQAKLHGLGQGSKTLTPKSVGEAAGDHVLRVMQQLAEGMHSGKVIRGEVIDGKQDT